MYMLRYRWLRNKRPDGAIEFQLVMKLSCDSRFQRAFTACSCVFKVITLVLANQRNLFDNTTTCSKRIRKTLVATQLKVLFFFWTILSCVFPMFIDLVSTVK